jgi:hypothetical protein
MFLDLGRDLGIVGFGQRVHAVFQLLDSAFDLLVVLKQEMDDSVVLRERVSGTPTALSTRAASETGAAVLVLACTSAPAIAKAAALPPLGQQLVPCRQEYAQRSGHPDDTAWN